MSGQTPARMSWMPRLRDAAATTEDRGVDRAMIKASPRFAAAFADDAAGPEHYFGTRRRAGNPRLQDAVCRGTRVERACS